MSCFGAIHCAGSALPCTFAKILHYQSSTADFLLPYSRLGHSLHFLQLEKFKHLARHRKTKLPANDPLEEDTDEEDLFGSKKRTSRQRARKREVKREVLTQYRDRFTKALRAELFKMMGDSSFGHGTEHEAEFNILLPLSDNTTT
eukprot:Gb_24648 [translate_table: standard]